MDKWVCVNNFYVCVLASIQIYSSTPHYPISGYPTPRENRPQKIWILPLRNYFLARYLPLNSLQWNSHHRSRLDLNRSRRHKDGWRHHHFLRLFQHVLCISAHSSANGHRLRLWQTTCRRYRCSKLARNLLSCRVCFIWFSFYQY